MMDDKSLLEKCKKAVEMPFTGWDFSSVADSYYEERLPWSYRKKINDFLKGGRSLLDMGTGGGEFLLSLKYPFSLTSVTEGYRPNYELCKERLGKLGITVGFIDEDNVIPYEDESFDIVINRHEEYRLDEVKRVLKPNGFFITQQVGGMNNIELARVFGSKFNNAFSEFNLENEVQRFKQSGFRIMYRNQAYVNSVFTDIGVLCYYVNALPWQFPDFSPEENLKELIRINREIEAKGSYKVTCHRFIIIAKKSRDTN